MSRPRPRPRDKGPDTLRIRLADMGLTRCPPVYLPDEIVAQIVRAAEEHLPTVNAARKEIKAERAGKTKEAADV